MGLSREVPGGKKKGTSKGFNQHPKERVEGTKGEIKNCENE